MTRTGNDGRARAAARQDLRLVVTRTPLRLSFAGGGTDLPSFYEHGEGAVISTAIDKYIYVTVKRHGVGMFDEAIRVNYSKSEKVERIDDIENDIARECLRFVGIDPPVYVSTVGDMPASSGLGGSSSFAVGLLNALHALKGDRVSAAQLADEACHIEIDVLGQPIGKQDQYAAAFGGLNLFRFQSGGRVVVEPQHPRRGSLKPMFESIMLFWTGHQRDASSVLTEQKARTEEQRGALTLMRDHALRIRDLMVNGEATPEAIGHQLHETWLIKRGIASTITNPTIDDWYDRAMAAGAEGGKLAGAGGGGFLLLIVRPEHRARVRAALHDLEEARVGPHPYGSRVMLPPLE